MLMMELVSTDFGISIVPESLLHLYKEYPVNVHKIAESESLTGDVGLIWLKDQRVSNGSLKFADMLQASVRGKPGNEEL